MNKKQESYTQFPSHEAIVIWEEKCIITLELNATRVIVFFFFSVKRTFEKHSHQKETSEIFVLDKCKQFWQNFWLWSFWKDVSFRVLKFFRLFRIKKATYKEFDVCYRFLRNWMKTVVQLGQFHFLKLKSITTITI